MAVNVPLTVDSVPAGPATAKDRGFSGRQQGVIVPTLVRLPCTSTRTQRRWGAHVKVLERIHPTQHYMPFYGRIYRPGSSVWRCDLPERIVAIECAGPQGEARRGKKREVLWILWEFDEEKIYWRELTRALALSWEWTLIFREPAMQALHPETASQEILAAKSADLAAELIRSIDEKIEWESLEVRANVLSMLYAQVAGRLVNTSRTSMDTTTPPAGATEGLSARPVGSVTMASAGRFGAWEWWWRGSA